MRKKLAIISSNSTMVLDYYCQVKDTSIILIYLIILKVRSLFYNIVSKIIKNISIKTNLFLLILSLNKKIITPLKN